MMPRNAGFVCRCGATPQYRHDTLAELVKRTLDRGEHRLQIG
jgi:hypothetical protein